MRREDLYNVWITVTGSDGTVVKFQCDKLSPIGMKAKPSTYRPANGLENEVSLGGPRKADNATLTRLYDLSVDERAHWLLSQCGRASVAISKQAIDENGHPFGSPLNLTGKLDDFTTAGTDSESEKPALCTFMCTVETNVG
jgi:hypothetical protein